jgi:hypothetical protein
VRKVEGGKAEEEMGTTTTISDYFLDSVLATEGVLHGMGLERVAGPRLSLSMRSFRSGPRSRMWSWVSRGRRNGGRGGRGGR